MIVLKFGGTSVQDSTWIDKALDISINQLEDAPVVVSSAMGKTTDLILEMIDWATGGQLEDHLDLYEKFIQSHKTCALSFLEGDNLRLCEAKLEKYFKGFLSFLRGISLLKECSLRSKDALLSFGERLSTTLIYHRAIQRGVDAIWIDARDFMITDEAFSSATPLIDRAEQKIKARIVPHPGKLIITQGFIGSTESGVTTTLGRGGSDYSASIIGAALKAREVQIWTDVTGIMTSDPRSVKGVKTIDSLTYKEAGELAYFGAKVVHPATIQPAVGLDIPVLVKSTREPKAAGTVIKGELTGKGLKAIATKKKMTLIHIESSKMLHAYGFLHRIFAIFEKYQTPVDLISTSEVSVSITIEQSDSLKEIVEELSNFATVTTSIDESIICLVGQDLWKDSLFISKVFETLAGTPIRMISLGSSDINLSIVVPKIMADTTVQKLHDAFLA